MQSLGYNESKQRGTFDFPIEFYHIDKNHPQYIMSYHWHVEYEIIRILEGSFYVSLDEREYEAQKGDILILNSGTLHGGTPKDCIYQCIVFDMNMLLKKENVCSVYIKDIMSHKHMIREYYPSGRRGAAAVPSEGPAPKEEAQEALRQHLDCLFDTLKERAPGYELIIQGLLYLILGSITINHFYTRDSLDTQRNHKRIHLLKQVLELMEESYQSILTLEQLSKAAGMSPKYFCRFFHEMTHKSPFEYLNNYRVERAGYQLLATEDSITEIAYACGFNDLSYFIKMFKRYKGITPAKYRKLNSSG